MKRCTGCGATKALAEFHRDCTTKTGHMARCKECRAHPHERAKDRHRKTGVSKELFAMLLQKQGGRCAICEAEVGQSSCADHAHVERVPRGVLCDRHNRGLGYFQDDPVLLLRAAMYLLDPPATFALREFATENAPENIRAAALRTLPIKII